MSGSLFVTISRVTVLKKDLNERLKRNAKRGRWSKINENNNYKSKSRTGNRRTELEKKEGR